MPVSALTLNRELSMARGVQPIAASASVPTYDMNDVAAEWIDYDSAGAAADGWNVSLTDGDVKWDSEGNAYLELDQGSTDEIDSTSTNGYQGLYNSADNSRYMIAVVQIDTLPTGTLGPGSATPWAGVRGDTIFSSVGGWYGVQVFNNGGVPTIWGYNWDTEARETGTVAAPLGTPFILEIIADDLGNYVVAVNGTAATGAPVATIGNTDNQQGWGRAYSPGDGEVSFGGRLYWAGYAGTPPAAMDRQSAMDELAWRFGFTGTGITPTDPGTAIVDPVTTIDNRLLMWLRADNTSADAINPGFVRTWQDLSGYERNAIQFTDDATSNSGVTVVNRGPNLEPSVSIGSTTTNLICNRTISEADRLDLTIVACAENFNFNIPTMVDSRTTDNALALGEDNAGATTNGIYFGVGATDLSETALVPSTFGDIHVIVASRDGTDISVRGSDLNVEGTGTTTSNTATAIPIGLGGDVRQPMTLNNGAHCWFWEVRIYEGQLTATEINEVAEYMGLRYGVTVTTLPTVTAPPRPTGTGPAPSSPAGALIDYTTGTFERASVATMWDPSVQQIYDYAVDEPRYLADGSILFEIERTPLAITGTVAGSGVEEDTNADAITRIESVSSGWNATATTYDPGAGAITLQGIIKAGEAPNVGQPYRLSFQGATNNISNKGILPADWTRVTWDGTSVAEGTALMFEGRENVPDPGDPALPAGIIQDGFNFQVEQSLFPTSFADFGTTRSGEALTFNTLPSAITDGQWELTVAPLFADDEMEDGGAAAFITFPNADPLLFDTVGFVRTAGVTTLGVAIDNTTMVETGALTFVRNQPITISVNATAGSLTVSGANSGNGTFIGSPWSWGGETSMLVGAPAASGTGNLFAFSGTVGPIFAAEANVVGIEQDSINSVIVTFDEDVSVEPPTVAGSGRNPNAYTLDPADRLAQTGEEVTPRSVRIFFDGPLTPGIEYALTVSGVLSAAGTPVNDFTGTFIAFGQDRQEAATAVRDPNVYDIANPQTPRDAGPTGALATFHLDEAGDLVNDSGRVGLRKRIWRRLSSKPGGFFHLADYGLRAEDKTLITPTRLRELQLNIEDQIRREPEVVGVRARVSEIQPGLIRVRIRVQDNLGDFEDDGMLNLTGESDA